jgi:hypothetical protein
MGPAKRPASVALLVGLVLLVTAAGLMVSLIPLAQCPKGNQASHEIDAILRKANRLRDVDGPHCFRCNDRFRITLVSKWMGGEGNE